LVDLSDVIARARSLMALAESVGRGMPGAAGLAYQAADLASKVLLVKTDGADIWSHGDREQRLSELLGIDAADLRFLHETRQLDFYADRRAGGPMELPVPDDCIRAVAIARRVVDAIDAHLGA
jgi:HEPN domain-containing protein